MDWNAPTDELYQPFALRSTQCNAARPHGRRPGTMRRLPDVIHEIDARQPVSRIQTLEAVRRRSLTPPGSRRCW
jgi:hypothetical protein